MNEPVVGVIGGMGPEATVELMRRVIAATPADDDADHIHMIVDNNPKVPSRIQALIEGTGDSPGPVIASMARRLQQAGADFLVMPCNTAHYYWPFAAEAVSIPVLHMVDMTLGQIAHAVGAPAQVGMLASPAVRKVGLYESFGDAYDISFIYPDKEDVLLDIIKAVKADRVTQRETRLLNNMAEQLTDAGADALVLGCTEFSLISDCIETATPVFDTLQVLTERILFQVKGVPIQPAG